MPVPDHVARRREAIRLRRQDVQERARAVIKRDTAPPTPAPAPEAEPRRPVYYDEWITRNGRQR